MTSPRGLSARLVTLIEASPDMLRRRRMPSRRLPFGRCDPGEETLRSRDADAELDRLAGVEQRELGSSEGRENFELVQRPEMSDAKHAATKLTETDTEREIQAL